MWGIAACAGGSVDAGAFPSEPRWRQAQGQARADGAERPDWGKNEVRRSAKPPSGYARSMPLRGMDNGSFATATG